MDARTRMVAAAYELFDEQGYEATTVDMIVERAGVSRSTFFRAFGAKDDVIFPRHAELRSRIADRLATGSAASWETAVREAALLVLEHYLAEGEQALARYRLTRTVADLRDRELASQLGYQRLFRDRLAQWFTGPDADLDAEVLAAAVVTAHNVVLRRWLRGESADPRADFEHAMARVLHRGAPSASASTVLVVESSRTAAEVAALLRTALA